MCKNQSFQSFAGFAGGQPRKTAQLAGTKVNAVLNCNIAMKLISVKHELQLSSCA